MSVIALTEVVTLTPITSITLSWKLGSRRQLMLYRRAMTTPPLLDGQSSRTMQKSGMLTFTSAFRCVSVMYVYLILLREIIQLDRFALERTGVPVDQVHPNKINSVLSFMMNMPRVKTWSKRILHLRSQVARCANIDISCSVV